LTYLNEKLLPREDSKSRQVKDDLLKQIAKDFESFLRHDFGDVDEIKDGVGKSFRDLGYWVHDEENNYDNEDDGWREDDDNKIWASGQYSKYKALFNDWAKGYKWYDKVTLEIETSEKSYCEFKIYLK
jgi:hypothetical protein